MARVSLTLPCGAELKMGEGSTLILGREHAMGQQAAYVSKEQASLSLSNGALTLTSVAKTNATIVMRVPPANLLKICLGQSYVLQHGDQIGLTGKFQLVDVAIYPSTDDAACPSPPRAQAEAPAAASSPISQTIEAEEAEEATESGPPSKRARTDASLAPASPTGAAAITATPLSDFAPAVGMAWAPHAGELLVGTPTGGASGGAAGSGKVRVVLFDLDHTLVQWLCRPGNFPLKAADFAVPSAVVDKLKALAADGQKLVIMCNNATIKGAFDGTNAQRLKETVERLATAVAPAPLLALVATKKPSDHRTPGVGMWKHLLGRLGAEVDREHCVYVSASGSEARAFATAMQVQFASPEEFFGFTTPDGRGWAGWGGSAASGAGANAGAQGDLSALGALLAGHLRGPLLLLLSGPPGSGKSTFCEELLRCCGVAGDPVLTGWTVVCQDTAGASGIKPGKREKVEAAAKAGLARGQSVVVDRTNLDATQRAHFTAIGRGLAVPVHVLVFSTPHAKCAQRVKQRVGHPGGVEGDRGVGVLKRFGKLSPPSLAEQIDTIVSCADEAQVSAAARMYACGVVRAEAAGPSKRAQAHGSGTIDAAPAGQPPLAVPAFGWGLFEVAAGKTEEALAACRAASQERGCVAVDTAPTYKNEAAVGRALALWPAAFVPFVIVKVPKAVTDPAQVRPTLLKSLGLLGVQCADLLLLHWPSDVVEAGTLTSVWGAMQALVAEGLARGVGVCNFTIGALELLPSPPLLVQVERHPLLPQWELAHYCAARGIVLQAHMPLGGKIGACELLAHVTVARVARECGRTAAQVLLRWNLQHGCAAITRAGAVHAGGNGALAFTIGAEHMHLLDGMSAPPAGGTKRFLSAARVAFMRKPGAAYSW